MNFPRQIRLGLSPSPLLEVGDGGEGVRARLVGRRIFRRRKPKM